MSEVDLVIPQKEKSQVNVLDLMRLQILVSSSGLRWYLDLVYLIDINFMSIKSLETIKMAYMIAFSIPMLVSIKLIFGFIKG